MFFFTILIFLSELILAIFVISAIISADNKVNKLNLSLNKNKVKFIWRLRILKDIVSGFNDIFPHLKKKAKNKASKLLIAKVGDISLWSFMLFFKSKYKRLFWVVRLLLAFQRYTKYKTNGNIKLATI